MTDAQAIAVEAPLVQRLLEDQFPELASLSLTRFPGSGTDNHIFRLGPDLAVRLPKVAWAASSAAREQAILPHLEAAPLVVPKLVGVGQPAHGYPWGWSVVSWLEGEQLEGVQASPLETAQHLAAFTQVLRDVPPDPACGYGAANNFRGCPLADRQAQLDSAFDDLEGELDVAALRRIWAMALAVDEDTPPVWLHGDMHGGNLLAKDGKLSAVIDWGLAGVGDGACDLWCAWDLFETEPREVFRREVCANEAEWLRGAGWALSVSAIFVAYYRHRGVDTHHSRRMLARLIEAFA